MSDQVRHVASMHQANGRRTHQVCVLCGGLREVNGNQVCVDTAECEAKQPPLWQRQEKTP